MAHYDDAKKNKSYVFGYDNRGRKIPFKLLTKEGSFINTIDNSIKDALYVFDVEKVGKEAQFNGDYEGDEFLNQKSSVNKNNSWYVSVDEIQDILEKAERIKDGLYCYPIEDTNLIICEVYGADILIPEKIPSLEYSEELNSIDNKRYLIFNKWSQTVDDQFYKGILSNVLKIRTVESFSCLIFTDGQRELCYQTEKNKNVQIIQKENSRYGLDFSRMSGPEGIWRKSEAVGMKKDWRVGYETLLKYIEEHK